MMLDRSDNNAPNQAMAFSNAVIEQKRKQLKELKKTDVLANFTIDSPVPYKLIDVLNSLKEKDTERVPPEKPTRDGPLAKKLTRFIQRLETKKNDKRLNFLFNENDDVLKYDYIDHIAKTLLHSSSLAK